jgi:heme-degrading monooxygenase HmoA
VFSTKEELMHARVTTLDGTPGDIDSGVANFETNVLPFAREQGEGAILLVDRESGKAISITLWEDEAALRASDEAANALRAEAADRMGVTGTPAVQAYEVAVFET